MSASPILRLLRLFAPDRPAIALAGLLQFGTIAAGVALMATSAWLISRAAERPSIAALSLAVVGVRAFGIGRGVLRYLERVVAHEVTLRLLTRMRGWAYQMLEPLSPARLVDRRSGDVTARVVADVEALEHVYVRLIGPTLAAACVIVLVAVVLAPRGTWLAGIAAAGLAWGGVGVSWLAWRAGRDAGRRVIAWKGELEALIVDGAHGLAELVAFGRTRDHAMAVDRAGRELARAQVRAAGTGALGNVLTLLAADLTVAAVLVVAVAAVSRGELDGVQLAVVALLTLAAFEAVMPLPAAWQALASAEEAARRLFDLADTPPALAPVSAATAAPAGYRWELRGLTFTYPGASMAALREVSLELAPGRILAVVGPSGSGKSTLVSLLLRFWDVAPEAIAVDGLDVRRLDPDVVRRLIAALPQRIHLFTGTVAENLRIARPDASNDDLRWALGAAGLDELVRQLPEGIHTWIGEQGLSLSGGERQRLAFARALLKRATLLVLDEPTAHVDAVTERRMLAAVRCAAHDRGVLVVTHRLAGLEIADEIVVLVEGRIVERGAWRELAAADGWFGRMLRLQSANIEELLEVSTPPCRPGA